MFKTLSKFSLNHCELPTMLGNVAVMLRVNSINIDRNYKRIPLFCYFLTTVSLACFLYVGIFSILWYSFVRCRQTGDMVSAAVSFSIGTCSGPSLCKFFYMKFNSDVVFDLLENYIDCDTLVAHGTRYASNLLKYLKIIKKRATLLWASLVINGIIYIIMPHMIPGRHFCQGLHVLYGFEPMTESPNYEIATILTFLGVYFVVCTLANTAVLIVVTVGYLEAQLLALSEELDHLWEDSKTFYLKMSANIQATSYDLDMEDEVRNLFIRTRLRDIIKFHIMCINLRDRLEKELRIIFVADFLLVILGIVSELLGKLENTYLLMPYTFVQVFVECFIGQKLIDASDVFEAAVYGCKWENFNVANQKIVLIMLQSSQKTLTMSAGGIIVLGYTSLMSFIRTTYSAYTTMQTQV